jgi:2',3'-cyclic-nucleotide 2'-phosphodiesterase/3'-nucleotidase
VIAVPHSGISAAPRTGRDENAVWHLAAVPGVDAILSGHSHQVFPSATYERIPEADIGRGTLRGVPTVMAGSWGSHLGVVDLRLKKAEDGWHVVEGTGATRAVSALAGGAAEADVRAAVAADHAATLAYLQTGVGEAAAPIHSYFSQIEPSSAVQIVQQAQLWLARRVLEDGGAETAPLRGLPLLSASAPLKAGGSPSNYTDVAAGPLTLRSVADLYVYPNTVMVVKITGAALRDWLEMAAGAFNRIDPSSTAEQALLNPVFPAYNFDQILGVDYTLDVTQPARFDKAGTLVDASAHRVQSLTIAGRPVADDAEVLVVTNNYRANGGGNFPGLDGTKTVLDPGRESREALRAYVQSLGTVGGDVVQNWRLAPVPGATVGFRTSPRARGLVAGRGGLELTPLADDADGFTRFRLSWPGR